MEDEDLLSELDMMDEMDFDEEEHLSSQVLVLKHDHLGQSRQRMLLKHVLRVSRHGQVVLELHRCKDLIDDPQRQNAFADVQRVALENP